MVEDGFGAVSPDGRDRMCHARPAGHEPSSTGRWQFCGLNPSSNTKIPTPNGVGIFVVGEDGFEPSKRNAADLQSVPFGHSGTPPYSLFCYRLCLEPVDGLEPPTY